MAPVSFRMNQAQPVIEVEHFAKHYGSFTAVEDLSFDVKPGQIVGVVGANGAGKTTTLRAITGILRPTAGTIRVAGHDIEREPVKAKKQFAYVPDTVHPYDLLTVTEHLHFIALTYRIRRCSRNWSWRINSTNWPPISRAACCKNLPWRARS